MRILWILLATSACTSAVVAPPDAVLAEIPHVEPSCSFESSRVGADLSLRSTGICDDRADLIVEMSDENHATIGGARLMFRPCPFSESLGLTITQNVGVYLRVGIVPTGTTQWYACPRRRL